MSYIMAIKHATRVGSSDQSVTADSLQQDQELESAAPLLIKSNCIKQLDTHTHTLGNGVKFYDFLISFLGATVGRVVCTRADFH